MPAVRASLLAEVLALRAPVVVRGSLRARLQDPVRDHAAPAVSAEQDAPQLVEPVARRGRGYAVLDPGPRRLDQRPRHPGVRHGDRDPLLPRLHHGLLPQPVLAGPVRAHLRDPLVRGVPPPEPPHAVGRLRVEPRGHVGGQVERDLLVGVRAVAVVLDDVPDGPLRPPAPLLRALGFPGRLGCGHPLAVQRLADPVHGRALRADHAEYPADHLHLRLVDHVPVAPPVVAETVVRGVARYQPALPGLLHLPAPAALRDLRPLELRQLVEDAVREFAFGRVVAPVVQRPQPRALLGELLLEQVQVGGFPGEAVPVLGHNQVYPAPGNQVPNPVEAGPLEAGPALPAVLYLRDYLPALAQAVSPQRLLLLPERVPVLPLLLRGNPAVRDRVRHAPAPFVPALILPPEPPHSARERPVTASVRAGGVMGRDSKQRLLEALRVLAFARINGVLRQLLDPLAGLLEPPRRERRPVALAGVRLVAEQAEVRPALLPRDAGKALRDPVHAYPVQLLAVRLVEPGVVLDGEHPAVRVEVREPPVAVADREPRRAPADPHGDYGRCLQRPVRPTRRVQVQDARLLRGFG
ncbi:MAG: hypothetical protein AVDCRST_MAG03-2878 [uncultured Rubrobacteraceae bacterium]|uniref:Uncharacterized protein n=1 Tax=uncultured Rubrobacteraceae bacterium TaxID=349277 RepID=A0A6J4PTM2_9ACTN|nr:MAG: hypothetical protein AVDCRST_MAG03-2878 [uncultured Rubrobacteraceae bacterium]